jgi:hypothetical protein
MSLSTGVMTEMFLQSGTIDGKWFLSRITMKGLECVARRDSIKLRMGKLFDLYQDPFERGDASLLYDDWFVHHAYMMYGATAMVAQWLQSFKEFPPRAKPASFNLDEVMREMTTPKN